MNGSEVAIALIAGFFWGIICSNIAGCKGRSTGLAFICGFLFGLLAVIYYATARRVGS